MAPNAIRGRSSFLLKSCQRVYFLHVNDRDSRPRTSDDSLSALENSYVFVVAVTFAACSSLASSGGPKLSGTTSLKSGNSPPRAS
jgi:hypothetical protein